MRNTTVIARSAVCDEATQAWTLNFSGFKSFFINVTAWFASSQTALLAMTAAILPSTAFAFFCPTNFNQINFGDTMDQVKQQCGNPAKEETKDLSPAVPQEWTYYIPQTVTMGGSMQQAQGTLKLTVAFDKDGKAVNISANGIGVGSTQLCNNQTLALGDTEQTVKNACGEPSFINQEQPKAPSTDTTMTPDASSPNKITEYTYTSNPPEVLVFQGGVLTEKK